MERSDQRKAPLIQALKEFKDRRPVYFCIPGHRFTRGIPDILLEACDHDITNFDLTEAPGLDDLHQADGAIKEAEELLAALFEADRSRFLVNGTTCGIEAAILSCVSPGEKILLPRNAHRSVIGGLIMSGAVPVWFNPEYDEKSGFFSCVNANAVREIIRKDRGIKAVLVVSPTYYGTLSDIRKLASVCHAENIPLIVDEAHGAHLYFSGDLRTGALRQGADISIMSAHKTLFSFGQSSFMHIKEGLVSAEKVDSALKLVMSSSPSYMLMASLDAARYDAACHGYDSFARAKELSFLCRKRIGELGIAVYGGPDPDAFDYTANDPTRVVFSAASLRMSGPALKKLLFDKYNIAAEMADRRNIVLVITSANSVEDVKQLTAALKAIREKYKSGGNDTDSPSGGFSHIPVMKKTPRETYFSKRVNCDISGASGQVAGESIIVYPPGNAIVYAGEIIDQTVLKTIDTCLRAGLTIQTESGHDLSEIVIVKE